MIAWVLALAAAAAVAGAVSPGASALGRLRAEPPKPGRVAVGTRFHLLAAVALLAAAGLWGGGGVFAAGLAVMLAGVTAAALLRRHRARAVAAHQRALVAESARVLAGLLRVGVVPTRALVLADDCPPLAEARAAQLTGGDVPAALRRSAGTPGREGLAELAAAWSMSQRSGASLVNALETVANSLSETEEAVRAVAVELAGPRAGGMVLGVLPMVGLALGFVLGGNPIVFLASTPLGWVCLVFGVGLMCAGLWWSDAIAGGSSGRGH